MFSPNRREFLTGAAACAAYAALGRGVDGTRVGMRKGGHPLCEVADMGWKNPYPSIPDIAMWDGEWNVEGGKPQKPSATTIKNLVSDLDLYCTGTPIWGDNYFRVENRYSAWYSNITDLLDDCYSTKTFTFELVENASTYVDGDLGLIYGGGDRDQGCSLSNYCGAGGTRYAAYAHNGAAYFQTGNTSVRKAYMALVLNAGSAKLYYKFGTSEYVKTSTVSSFKSIVSKRICIGTRYSYQAVSSRGCDYYSARVHSNALTDEQISANYAIDQQRFNIV